jgi:hypothetical protein
MNLTQTTSFYCTESFDEKIEFWGPFYGPKKSLEKNLYYQKQFFLPSPSGRQKFPLCISSIRYHINLQ